MPSRPTSRTAGWLHTALLSLSLLLAGMHACHAQETIDGALERRVKAAFLYRFLEYVTWPDQAFARPDAPLVIGVLASEGIAGELVQVVKGRSVHGRPVAVRTLHQGENLGGLHALFIGAPANPRLSQIAREAQGPVLIVTEAESGLTQGGIINFLIADGRVRFEIALRGAEKRVLRLSARLLSVAMNVRKDTRLPPLMDIVARLDRTLDLSMSRLPESWSEALRQRYAFDLIERIISVR